MFSFNCHLLSSILNSFVFHDNYLVYILNMDTFVKNKHCIACVLCFMFKAVLSGRGRGT